MISDKKFLVSQIKNKTVGEILEEARREQNLSLEKASELTHIHKNHLIALESGNYSALPEGIYSEKLLETYVDFLNIDFPSLKKLFTKELQINKRVTKDRKSFVSKISSRNLIVAPRIIKVFTAVLAVLILLIYLGFEISNIFSPPPLDIFNPIDNLVTVDPTIEVIGQTEKEVKIKINDQEIQGDKTGYFKEFVSLKAGLNIIKISAAKKRSKENVVYRRVILVNNEP
jgi:transcriptional regulator with XRE-family HTH domain